MKFQRKVYYAHRSWRQKSRGQLQGNQEAARGRFRPELLLGVSVGGQGRAGKKFRIGCRNHSGGLWTVEVVPSCLESGPGTFK